MKGMISLQKANTMLNIVLVCPEIHQNTAILLVPTSLRDSQSLGSPIEFEEYTR